MARVRTRKGNPRGGGKSVATAVKRLTRSQSREAGAVLDGWRKLRRAREHHEEMAAHLKAGLQDQKLQPIWPRLERNLCSAEAWVDGIDAAIVLYEKKGPERVFEEARGYAYSAVVVKDYEYVLRLCRKAKAGALGFSGLPREDRLRLAAMTGIPVRPDATEAEWAKLWKRAEGRARRVFDSPEVQTKLHSEGPSRAADEVVAQLKETNASKIRRLRGGR